MLIVKDDQSILLLKTDKKGELDEVDLGSLLVDERHISACLYTDRQGFFTRQESLRMTTVSDASCIMALFSSKGTLSIFSLSDLTNALACYEGVHFLPSLLSRSTPLPRHWKGGEEVSELLIAEIGDSDSPSPYLILKTSGSDVTIYEPFTFSSLPVSEDRQLDLSFKKISIRQFTNAQLDRLGPDDGIISKKSRPMKKAFVNGLHVVFVPGQSPAMIASVATSCPRVYNLSGDTILAFGGHHTSVCSEGFVYIDTHDDLCFAQLPADTTMGHSGWIERKVALGVDVSGIAYLQCTQSYVLAASHPEDFQLPQDDEWHSEWKNEHATCLPQVEQGSIKLLSSKTFNMIDSFKLEHAERAMCIKSMNLEISEETHERKELIVVGTAITKGEDVVSRGAIYVFDIVDVVPQPGVPETDLKLKLVAKEEVKGAVTSLSRIGSQGFMLAAQGQKCMVRGLKEDLSILPVAFMDMQFYVSVAKELSGTGLCILGDAMKGLWLAGYSVSAHPMPRELAY